MKSRTLERLFDVCHVNNPRDLSERFYQMRDRGVIPKGEDLSDAEVAMCLLSLAGPNARRSAEFSENYAELKSATGTRLGDDLIEALTDAERGSVRICQDRLAAEIVYEYGGRVQYGEALEDPHLGTGRGLRWYEVGSGLLSQVGTEMMDADLEAIRVGAA